MAYKRALTATQMDDSASPEEAITQAAKERIDDFRTSVLRYMRSENMTVGDLAIECELDRSTLSNFFTRIRSANGLTLMKISVGSGIPL